MKLLDKLLEVAKTRKKPDCLFTVTKTDGTTCEMELWALIGEVTSNPAHGIVEAACPPTDDNLWQAIADAVLAEERGICEVN